MPNIQIKNDHLHCVNFTNTNLYIPHIENAKTKVDKDIEHSRQEETEKLFGSF